jgi:hypothetical protein
LFGLWRLLHRAIDGLSDTSTCRMRTTVPNRLTLPIVLEHKVLGRLSRIHGGGRNGLTQRSDSATTRL